MDQYPEDPLERRVDALSAPEELGSFDRAVYRLGFYSIAVPGLPAEITVGGVTIKHLKGPVSSQRTEIQQRPGLELAFDKKMNVHLEVGRGRWLAICEVPQQNPGPITEEIPGWRSRARSALGLACLVLDDRLAIAQAFEDVLLFRGQEVAAADQVDRLRHFLPYEVGNAERADFERLTAVELAADDTAEIRAARWYLKAIELGPTPDAVIYFWCAIEALVPSTSKKDKAVRTLLEEADWDPDLLDAPVRQLVELRSDVVHEGLDDPKRLREGCNRLETITRLVLRHRLGLKTSWPEYPPSARFSGPEADKIAEAWSSPPQVTFHDDLPDPDDPVLLKLRWERIDGRKWDGEPPRVEVTGHLEPGWSHRLRSAVREAARRLSFADEMAEIVVRVENPAGLDEGIDAAVNREAIFIRPRAMEIEHPGHIGWLIWVFEGLTMKHALIRRGLEIDHGWGVVLLELVGAWAQQRLIEDAGVGGDQASFGLTGAEGENPMMIGRALGAAMAGNEEASEVLSTWETPTGVEYAGMVAEWADIESPAALLDAAITAYHAVIPREGDDKDAA